MTRALLLAPLLLLTACQDTPEPDLPPPAATPPTEPTPATAGRVELRVGDAYAFATPAGGTAGLFMTIDAALEPDTLLDVRSDAAARTEVHESYDAGGGMRGMRPVLNLPVPNGGGVRLEPGGYHVMLIETTRALAPGDTLAATAVFAKAGEVPVRAAVRPLDAAPEAPSVGSAAQ